MNRATNILIQLGEALGPQGAFVVLLLLCAGAVWVVMAIRTNQADHARVEKKIDTGLERVEGKVESLRKEAREESKEARAESKETRAQIQALRDETRAESNEARAETRAELRAINSRLDQLIGRKPPDQPS